ncbi:MAG: hypothetical protein FWF12_00025 [Betaproteobacteria bacterium]|nr:hypothetical protein [Betaproteobacteria bacterium]
MNTMTMSREEIGDYYAKNTGMIHQVAVKGFKRLQAIGAAIEYEDVVQELTETFIKSYDLFDASLGMKFSTYFMRSAFNRVNAIVEHYELERVGIKTTRSKMNNQWKGRRTRVHAGTSSVEEMSSRNSEDGGVEVMALPSGGASPEQIVEIGQRIREMMSCLSPVAAKLVEMTLNPPEFVERELRANQANSEFARANNLRRRCRSAPTLPYVAFLMEKTSGIPVVLLKQARKEAVDFVRRHF